MHQALTQHVSGDTNAQHQQKLLTLYCNRLLGAVALLIPSKSAKIQFEYEVINISTGALCAVGKTMQVFLEKESRTLELITPDFYREWKERNL